ncbi:MAG: hypothetical protein AAFY69_15750 [Pseudomonadota bacterium]
MRHAARWIVVLPVMSALVAVPAAADEAPDNRARVKSTISAVMSQHLAEDGVAELLESGLAKPDAERIIARFSDDAAECLLTVAEEKIIQDGGDPRSAMAKLKLEDLGDLFEDADELELRMESCLHSAIADAGLTLN